jgi:protoheme IX farnesyltransferase
MPPLLGHVALAGEPGRWGWLLFGLIFVWQFPHFLAIGWLHREDYRRAGVRVLAALPGAAGSTGRQALLHAVLLVPVSVLPCVRGDAGVLFGLAALACGVAYVAAAASFAWRETTAAARSVLVVSLIYLPVLFSAILFDPTVSRVLLP